MSSAVQPSHNDFFHYTSGRWLWDEEKQLRDRYKPFNVSELQRVAAASVGAHACLSMIKLGEGGFNKVFRLVMDDGSVVIARIPNPNAGPPGKAVASEVATMDFASTILEIPVPTVLAWSGDLENPVGSEYILMEEASGSHLSEVWEELEIHAKAEVVEELVGIEKKLLSLSFSRYGNLFFAKNAFEGCEKVDVSGNLPESRRLDASNRFVIGPVVDRDFWNEERSIMKIDRGPWLSAAEYLKAISQREKTWLSCYAVPKQGRKLLYVPISQNSVNAHVSLYDKFLAIAEFVLPSEGGLVKPTLWHWDLHAPNLFIDSKNKLTALIDWQDAWVGPLFLQARHPGLVRYSGEIKLQLPEYYRSLEDQEEKKQIAMQVEKSILLQIYESSTSEENPDLKGVLQIPHGPTRRQTVQYSSNTWDGDILPFRECLIRMERFWNEIVGPNAPGCPIHFTPEELQTHYDESEGWNEKADFWDSLSGFVSKDGWVAHENYEQASDMFSQMRDEGLKSLQGKERDEFEISTRWAAKSGTTTHL
ncbi:putative phosphotransferase enzyme family protein [Phaeomoniella chlamydospora]|uniref:Putative phosphotransferase enzyme family protein n=1 Tax=Phaeomoniella chlamydospora TaxID=158046 RepID=A0A0G2EAL4_PHACM|nr:putative phosphotransferase enzyme family protein [Phaeomoniella chlamydospora]